MLVNKNSYLFYGKHFTLTRTLSFQYLNCPQTVTISYKCQVTVSSILTVSLLCLIQCYLETKETTGKLLRNLDNCEEYLNFEIKF